MKKTILLLIALCACSAKSEAPTPQMKSLLGANSLTPIGGGENLDPMGGLARPAAGLGLANPMLQVAKWRAEDQWCESMDFNGVAGGHISLATSSGTVVSASGASGHNGVSQLRTAASATASSRALGNIAATAISTTYANMVGVDFVIALPTLSTITEEYNTWIGFGSTTNVGKAQVNGCGFVYDRVTSGDQWRICSAASSTVTCQTLDGTNGTVNVPVQIGSFINGTGVGYELQTTATGGSAPRCDFYVGSAAGTMVQVGSICASGCTLTATPPTGLFGPLAEIKKSAGTGVNENLEVDNVCFAETFARGRLAPTQMLAKVYGAAFGRSVTIKYPVSFDATPSTPRPLFIVAHPLGGNSTTIQTHLGIATMNEDYPGGAFVLSAPGNTIAQPGNAAAWPASTSCCDNSGPPPSYPNNDMPYFTAAGASPSLAGLIPQAIQLIQLAGGVVDTRRVVWIGESNGGFMGERVACEAPTRITHLVNVSGSGRTAGDLALQACTNLNIHYLTIQGPGDTTVVYAGGSAIPGLTPAMDPVIGFNATNEQHATRNGCSGTWVAAHAGAVFSTHDLVSDACGPGSETSCYRVTGCPATGIVQGCDIGTTCGHTTNLTFNTTTNFRNLVISFVQIQGR